MNHEEAEAALAANENFATAAVARLAVMTPGIHYYSARFEERILSNMAERGEGLDIESLRLSLMIVADQATRLPEGSSGFSHKMDGHSDAHGDTGDWTVEADVARLEIELSEKEELAISRLGELDAEALRSVLGRLIDTTSMTFVWGGVEAERASLLLCRPLASVLDEGESVSFNLALFRPGDMSGSLVQIRVLRRALLPPKPGCEEHPQPDVP